LPGIAAAATLTWEGHSLHEVVVTESDSDSLAPLEKIVERAERAKEEALWIVDRIREPLARGRALCEQARRILAQSVHYPP
jgi:hypothetical protein